MTELQVAKAYGRGDHLGDVGRPRGPMLTSERLSEVSWALGKMEDAGKAVDRLLEGEPFSQPPTHRRMEMERIDQELANLRERLESLYS